jgi:hypothetical protein
MTLHVNENIILKELNERLATWDVAVDKFNDVLMDYKPHIVTYWYAPGISKTEPMSLVIREGRLFSLWDEVRHAHRLLHVGDIVEVK